MRAASLREKAADYLRLARGLSAHSPTRRHLLVMAERLERQAEDLDKEFVDVGGAWAKIDEGNAVGGTLTANPAGVAGGGQIGCDIQFDQWVFGVRDMFDGTNLRSSTSFSAGSANTHTNWFDTLTARQGFLFQPNVLIYAQGGAAWTNTSVTVFNFTGTQIGQSSTNNNG